MLTGDSRWRLKVEPPSHNSLLMWREKNLPLPLLDDPHELRAFLLEPLKASERIPVNRSQFKSMLSSSSQDICERQHLECVFTISDAYINHSLTIWFVSAVLEPPSATSTENIYHAFWDQNISKPLQVVIPEATSRREKNWFTETRRPDYTLIIEAKCPFRGEEKSPENPGNPKTELIEKLVGWRYHPAPYILGRIFLFASFAF